MHAGAQEARRKHVPILVVRGKSPELWYSMKLWYEPGIPEQRLAFQRGARDRSAAYKSSKHHGETVVQRQTQGVGEGCTGTVE